MILKICLFDPGDCHNHSSAPFDASLGRQIFSRQTDLQPCECSAYLVFWPDRGLLSG